MRALHKAACWALGITFTAIALMAYSPSATALVIDRAIASTFHVAILAKGSQREGVASAFSIGEGLVVTAHHVTEGVEFPITLYDYSGKKHKAELVGGNPGVDVAVLRIKDTSIPAMAKATSPVKHGERMGMIGSPFGMKFTVTEGLVAHPERKLGVQNQWPGLPYVIQTSAPCQPGNSGGPIFNEKQELLGLVSALYNPSRTQFMGIFGISICLNIPAPAIYEAVDKIMDLDQYPGYRQW